MSDNRHLLFFSSSQYELYEQDIYDSLAYPPGFVIQFRYPKGFVSDELIECDDLTGDTGVIVGVSDENLDFYPLRKVTVDDWRWPREDMLLVNLRFEAELVDYVNKDPQESIEQLDSRPKEPGPNDEAIPGDFVAYCDMDTFDFADTETDDEVERWNEQGDEWAAIVEEMSADPVFGGNLFYRLLNFSRAGSNDTLTPQHEAGGSQKIAGEIGKILPISAPSLLNWNKSSYILKSQYDYKIDLEFNFGEDAPDNSSKNHFEVGTTEDIDVLWDDFDLGFRYDKRSIYLSPDPASKHNITPLITRVSGPTDIKSPELEIPILLAPDLRSRAFFGIAIFLGVAMAAGVFDFAIPLLPSNLPVLPTIQADIVSHLIKLLGVVITTLSFDYYRVYF